MSQTTTNRSPEEVAEIERHKYFLSEKVGHDVGWEAAEQDWDSKYGEQFRRQSGTQASKGMSMFLKRLLPRR